MRCLRLLLLLLVTLVESKMRGEQDAVTTQQHRSLINVFDAAALRNSLSTQRKPYQDPFRDEPSTNNLARRKHARQHEFGNMKSSKSYSDSDASEQPMLDLELRGNGKGKGKSMMGSKSKSTSKISSSSKSKMTGMSKGRGSRSTSKSVDAEHPTFSPTESNLTESPAPTVATDKPTCAPNSGAFPPDVSDFFQAPSGDESSDLQNELDSALSEIQVPSQFEQQCVQR